jgi:hypothetical protein
MMVSWGIMAGGLFVASLALILAEWIVRRARQRKGLQWCDNSPRRPDNTIER